VRATACEATLHHPQQLVRQAHGDAGTPSLAAEGHSHAPLLAFLLPFPRCARAESQSTDRVAEAAQERMLRAEEAFRRIKEATGDDDVNRVIQKYITQERDRRESEVNLQRAKEALAQAQDEWRAAQRALSEVAASENLGNKRIEEETAAKVVCEGARGHPRRVLGRREG